MQLTDDRKGFYVINEYLIYHVNTNLKDVNFRSHSCQLFYLFHLFNNEK